jgi:hypothetical protein
MPTTSSSPRKPRTTGPTEPGLPVFRAPRRAIILIWACWAAGVLAVAGTTSHLPGGNPRADDPGLRAAQIPLSRWDSGWYWIIAERGYSFDSSRSQNPTEFYPLYPLLARAIERATGANVFWCGVALSLACLLGSLLLLADLAPDYGEPDAGVASAAALLAFPTAFYFAAFYAESLFLFATVLFFRALRRGRFVVAGLAGAAAAMTRPTGVLLIAAAAAFLLERRDRGSARRVRGLAAAAGLTAAGAAAFPLFLGIRFGDPLLYFHRRLAGGWPEKREAPWNLFGDIAREARLRLTVPPPDGRFNHFLKIGVVILFLGLAVSLFRRRLWPEAVYVAATLGLLLTSGTIGGFHRYAAVLFPCFVVLGSAFRRRPALGVAYGFFGLMAGTILLVHYVLLIYVS